MSLATTSELGLAVLGQTLLGSGFMGGGVVPVVFSLALLVVPNMPPAPLVLPARCLAAWSSSPRRSGS
jgi:hypothetical protein